MQDLVVLVADKNAQFALRGALARHAAMGIRPVTFEFRTHPGRDGGVRTSGPDVLAGEASRFGHALLVMDHEGCGQSDVPALTIEAELDAKLNRLWGARGKAIVIKPEVDVWVWGNDNALRSTLDWPLDQAIRDWLRERGFEFGADEKPVRPKEALDAMRPVHKQPRSSALYEKITSQISLPRCTDHAFIRLRAQLMEWFPAG